MALGHLHKSHDQELHLSVIVDAGSSGTRVHAFEFDVEELSTIQQVFSKKLKPGLSSCFMSQHQFSSESDVIKVPQAGGAHEHEYSGNFAAAFRCAYNQTNVLLESLLAARDDIRSQRSDIPVFVRATAGLRLLPQKQRDVLLHATEVAVADQKFAPASYEDQRPRVITGTEEAVYDWLAVNVAKVGLPRLRDALLDVKRERTAADLPLMGVMDLGGASTQIAFHDVSADSECAHQQYFRGLGKVQLYAVSRLGFGVNELFQAALQEWTSQEQHRSFPCRFRNGDEDDVDGTADFTLCRNFIKDSLLVPTASQPSCWDKKVPDGVTFVAMDNLVKIAKLLFPERQFNTRSAQPVLQPPLDEFSDRAKKLCAMDLPDVRARRNSLTGAVLSEKSLPNACFIACYAHALLTEVYGFDEHDQRIQFADNVGSVEASWALGAAVFEFLSKNPI